MFQRELWRVARSLYERIYDTYVMKSEAGIAMSIRIYTIGLFVLFIELRVRLLIA